MIALHRKVTHMPLCSDIESQLGALALMIRQRRHRRAHAARRLLDAWDALERDEAKRAR